MYEHIMVERILESSIHDALSHAGKDGWELVSTIWNGNVYMLFFKHKVPTGA